MSFQILKYWSNSNEITHLTKSALAQYPVVSKSVFDNWLPANKIQFKSIQCTKHNNFRNRAGCNIMVFFSTIAIANKDDFIKTKIRCM